MGRARSMRQFKLNLCMLGAAAVAMLCCAGQAAHQPTAPVDSWPMFRGQPSLAGVAGGQLPEKLSLLWTFKTKAAIKSSPAIVNGRVYVGSSDNNVYAINVSDGKEAWKFATTGPVESSPLVLGNRVYVGSHD